MSAPAAIQFELWLGTAIAEPAPAAVMNQLQSASVERSSEAPGQFKLTFRLDRASGFADDFPLLSGGLVAPWNRAVCMVRLGSERTILIDGFITGHELSWEDPNGAAQLVVSGGPK